MNAQALAQEAEFFDRRAQERMRSLRPTEQAVLDRYRRQGAVHPKELCFQLLGDPRGKRVLDVGCGDGEDAVILAALGARVTGLDVSPLSVAAARRRAELDGVSARTDFVCAPLETAGLPESAFDVIWIDNVVHHVLDQLEPTLRALLRSARPGAQFICFEPVNLSKLLRRVRFLVPVHTEVTPGERPPERHEIAVLERLIPDLRRRHFNCLGRLTRFVLPDYRYESAAWPRRMLMDLLMNFDRVTLSVPALQFLGGMAVFWGRTPSEKK